MTFPLAPLRLSFDRRAVQRILLAGASLGESSMVEQRTLTPLILVRIQVSQPRSLAIPGPPRSLQEGPTARDADPSQGEQAFLKGAAMESGKNERRGSQRLKQSNRRPSFLPELGRSI